MSSDSNFYSENIKNIRSVNFNIFTNNLIKQYSAVKNEPFGINVSESYDNYEPKKGGLVDLRLGTCDLYLNCITCGLNHMDCPGHFGHTELAEPVFHFGFLTHLITVLKCICLKCSNILIEKTPEIIDTFNKLSSKNKVLELKILVKNISFCPCCGTPVPKIKKEVKENSASIKILLEKSVGNVVFNQATGESIEQKKVLKEYLSPRDCHNILINISDIDCHLLGFIPNESRPEDLIIQRFPIAPVTIRPTARIDFMSAATMEDSLTLKISDIITSNNRVRNQLNKDTNLNQNFDTHTLLQYHVATYYDNESASLPTTIFRTGTKPTKSISDRIKAKGGRIRNNLMGKRVDFCGRSVITSDPYISIEQVGVPLRIAMDLTMPEEVTPHNIAHLTNLILNGKDTYPGANFVLKNTIINGKKISRKIDLKYRKKDIKLSIGDIVERHIIDDDYILFNRQPTLHKPSMMGHRVHVLNRDDCNTFRMNVCVTEPYNADFDGDEMNIFLGQSIQAQNELKRIANVKLQIIGAKDSNPIIAGKQDAVAGSYLLTYKENIFSYNDAANLLCTTNVKNITSLKKNKSITGAELFSYLIPNGINTTKMKGGNVSFLVKNGKLLKGHLDSSQVADKKNSLVHFIWDKYGPSETTDFIDNTQKLILHFLYLKGLTVGFKDAIIDDKIDKEIKGLIHNKVLNLKYKITQIENEDNDMSVDLIEQQLLGELGSISLDTSKIITDSMSDTNNFDILLKSGAKGKPSNIAQIAGCLGQIAVSGGRVKNKVNNRTIPYFHQNDDTAEARGFASSNYVDGLKAHEFFFHHMAGREGLIDTAIKTADTGYISRRLIKALEDIQIYYDGTVRTSTKKIIQYIYGENGINQSKQTETKINLININNKEIENEYTFTKLEMGKLKFNLKDYNNEIIKKVTKFRDDLRKCHFNSTQNYKILTEGFNIPININRLIQEIINQPTSKYDLDPNYILNQIDNVITNYDNRIIVCYDKNSKLLKNDDIKMKYLLKICLYEYINPKKCIFKYNLQKKDFDNMIIEINKSLMKSLVEPGEMVGVVAAQSVGEPTSQMTLNTKHSAGVIGKGAANMGVSRIKEILSNSKNMKTPQMSIYFTEKYNKNKSDVYLISSYLKHLTIKELTEKAEIIYDTNFNDPISNMVKNDNVKNPFFINNKKDDFKNMPLLFRLKIDIESLMTKETSLLDIKTKFITYWYKNFNNLKSLKKIDKDIITKINSLAIMDNNDDIIHIRFNMSNYNYIILTEFLNLVLNTMTLKGIDNIENIDVVNERKIDILKDGSINVDKEFSVITNGINMESIKLIKGLDLTRLKINDINAIYSHYGIEAARSVLIKELTTTYNEGGSDINYTHLSVLVDLMTYNGYLISIDRHGLKKINSDPMSRATFEQQMEHFVNAALFNESDPVDSVSSRIMVGRAIKGGTGSFELFLDIDKISNSEYVENESKGRTSYQKLDKDLLFDDIINNNNTNLDFYIPN